MRKRPRADWRLKSTTSAVIAASRSHARGSAASVDPAVSPSKTTDGGVAAIAATPSDGAEPSACGSDFVVSSDNRRRPRQPMDGPRRTPYPFIAYQDAAAMRKQDLLRRKVEDIDLSRSSDLATLVDAMGHGGGFTAKKSAVGVEILRSMFRNRACTTFFSFPPALMAAGVRGGLRGLVE